MRTNFETMHMIFADIFLCEYASIMQVNLSQAFGSSQLEKININYEQGQEWNKFLNIPTMEHFL